MISFATLTDALIARQTSAYGLTYVDGPSSERAVRYRDFCDRALALLGAIQSYGASRGSELVILVDRNDQFIDAFWACQLGHIVAVPLATGNADERLSFA